MYLTSHVFSQLDKIALDIFSRQKFKYVPDSIGMNILNFINFENYYCQISPEFQTLLKSYIDNYSAFSRIINVPDITVNRVLNQRDYWINFQTLFDLTRRLNIPKSKVYYNISKIKTKNSFPINFDIKNLSSPAFFRIIGHILGDGGIHVIKKEGKYRAFYSNNQQVLLDSFSEDVKKVFGEVKLYSRNREWQGDEVRLPTTLGYLLYEILEYEKNKDKRVPNFVLDSKDTQLIGQFLQALYDDDGYLYPQKHMIVFSQKRRELLKGIRKVIENIGIKPNQVLIHKSKTRTIMYYFSITGKENILIFSKLVGFLHPIKREKLQLLVDKYGGR